MKKETEWLDCVIGYLSDQWRESLIRLDKEVVSQVQEIRFRCGKPGMITAAGKNIVLNPELVCSERDLENLFLAACEFSPGSRMNQIQHGYLLMRGGLRMGICGRCMQENGIVQSIHPISSLNIRILREVKGSAQNLVSQIRYKRGIHNTIILAPPGGGKTTILRDLIRILSDGDSSWTGMRVSVIDERGELAGCVMGIPTMDLGAQCDVLDGCSKSWGIRCMIRTMTPQVIAVDELGDAEDALAILDAARCGIHVVATAHGSCIEDLRRSALFPLLEQGIFSRVIIMNRNEGMLPVVMKI